MDETGEPRVTQIPPFSSPSLPLVALLLTGVFRFSREEDTIPNRVAWKFAMIRYVPLVDRALSLITMVIIDNNDSAMRDCNKSITRRFKNSANSFVS